jgi:hypothetical protein
MDDLDLGKLEALVALMRRLGVKSVGSVELWPEAPAVPAESSAATDKDLDALSGGAPEGDDALFWSVTGPLPSEIADASKPPVEP